MSFFLLMPALVEILEILEISFFRDIANQSVVGAGAFMRRSYSEDIPLSLLYAHPLSIHPGYVMNL